LADSLPNSAVIKVAAKTAEMIRISSEGFCGEDESLQVQGLREA